MRGLIVFKAGPAAQRSRPEGLLTEHVVGQVLLNGKHVAAAF